MKKLCFNKNYTLKPDDGKALLLSAYPGRNLVEGLEDSFTYIIHPIYAMLLCHMDNREYDVCIDEAAESLGIPKELVENFVEKLADNPNKVYIKNESSVSVFPPFAITTKSDDEPQSRYSSEMFAFDNVNMTMNRHKTPSTITLMVNNICKTDCVYYYQDKSRLAKCDMPLKRIIEIIREAKELNVNSIDVIGGEFFLYPHWRDVLAELRKFGYNPYLSTKIPISKNDANFLSQIGVIDIQVSLDSMIEQHLISSLKVKRGYADAMIESMGYLSDNGIQIMVHSVLSKFNSTIEDMSSLYSALQKIKNLRSWHIVKADPSLYQRIPYSEIEIEANELNKIVDYLQSIKEEGTMSIRYPEKSEEDVDTASGVNADAVETNDTLEQKKKKFFERSFCSGLFSSLYILPDGNVTMCEQLYWNKDFIVGNVLHQSLQEIWNSDIAKSLFFIKQEDIPADSHCSVCPHFKDCRAIRQVCYREIIRKYGKDKWYYPDVNCPFAGQNFKNE